MANNPPIKTNTTTLLREYSRIRQAALRSETVMVETKEGRLRITADQPTEKPKASGACLIGSMKDKILWSADDLDTPTLSEEEWFKPLP